MIQQIILDALEVYARDLWTTANGNEANRLEQRQKSESVKLIIDDIKTGKIEVKYVT